MPAMLAIGAPHRATIGPDCGVGDKITGPADGAFQDHLVLLHVEAQTPISAKLFHQAKHEQCRDGKGQLE